MSRTWKKNREGKRTGPGQFDRSRRNHGETAEEKSKRRRKDARRGPAGDDE